ncbi:hypothetical protein Halha_0539 [Halobacteroides halobius DSM 5150]|uniref:Stage III sporulation protein AG n=1 Tax=Halobacteroides halobius (strain ATCC 35273 / DSM 5150 / MD-1) TaxID=748449 RepID=L0K8R7_HALHC|nr:hypothetical protein [Halobacteroides halobius]AGB40513.1 hypothetical protein Halha_0539 [Halobacteroides halobius DSM 5150]
MLNKIFNIFTEEENSFNTKILLLLGLAGIFLIFLGDFTGSFTSNKTANRQQPVQKQVVDAPSFKEKIENQLQETLSLIAGVGKVKVNLTLDTSSEYIYIRNNIHSKEEVVETDNNGGQRKTLQTENEDKVVVVNQGGSEEPVIKKKIKPKIRGVLVVAEGAKNSYVRAKLIRAVEVGLGIPSHKIAVLPKER